jgi:hypothetical protein
MLQSRKGRGCFVVDQGWINPSKQFTPYDPNLTQRVWIAANQMDHSEHEKVDDFLDSGQCVIFGVDD